jgi:hypothetical protein
MLMAHLFAKRILPCALALALGACCGDPAGELSPPQAVDVDRDFDHEDARVHLPTQVEGWTRKKVELMGRGAMRIDYQHLEDTALTLHIHPRSPGEDLPQQNVQDRFQIVMRSASWPGDADQAPEAFSLHEDQAPREGLRAVTSGAWPRQELYLFAQGDWFLQYRLTTEAEALEPALRALMGAIHRPPKGEAR